MSIFAPDDEKNERYPYLRDYTSFLKPMERPLVGREREITQILAAMQRPELSNVILLAEAGSGKTALVQGTMKADTARAYLEVDLPKMIANSKNDNEMADMLKQLFNEVQLFGREFGKEIVLFIDEFHQIVQLSPAAVEVLKPLLADSGTRGTRVIAATTYIEFQEYIASNLPLVERLQRINLSEPDKKTVVAILRGMAERYGVGLQFPNDRMFEAIYDYTNQYIPANAQPRKSILMLDSMIGWHRFNGKPIDMKMLADVIYDTEGVNIEFRVNAHEIKEQLDKAVFAQQFASSAIESRLQICCAGLNNPNKPMASFLFTGSTGVGKGLRDDTIIPIYTDDGSVTEKRNGDLVVGDFVFNRKGEPVKITGVFHRGVQDIYKVSLSDGRCIYTDSSHLWTYAFCQDGVISDTYTNNTKELLDRGVFTEESGQSVPKYWIPMNQPVQYPDADLPVHPYIMGAFFGNKPSGTGPLVLSSNHEDLIAHIADMLGNYGYKRVDDTSFDWVFPRNDSGENLQVSSLFGSFPEICDQALKLPAVYKYASVEQRRQFVRGLFDVNGFVCGTDKDNHEITSCKIISRDLAKDIADILYSLGIANMIHAADNDTGYYIDVKSFGQDPQWVSISNIELMPEQAATTCIMVDDNEHLYQAGQYIVTHNTEMTKQLAKILFGDETKMIRMDMTEYALDDSLNRFREELTSRVWTRPYSIVLLDEIEKACPSVTRLLLQVLDDGRLIDRHNREVTFKNCYIVVTTNAGSEVYRTIAQYNSDDNGSGDFVDKYDKLIRDSIVNTTGESKFPPELLGRIDRIVPFQPLSEHTMAQICYNKLTKLRDEIRKKHGYELMIDEDIIRYIVQEKLTTDSDAGGARGVITRIEREVVTPVARFVNNIDRLKVKNNRIYVMEVGEMSVDNKRILASTAHIEVGYEFNHEEMQRRKEVRSAFGSN